MRITPTGPRPRAARLLIGAALAAVLALTTGGTAVAAPDTTGDVTIAERTDVYIQDIPSDVGYEPHGAIYSSFFNSPDVKVCPSAIECAAHTDPVVGSDSYIWVNLRNNGPYGSGDSQGTLKAYYTLQGGAAIWPTDWTLIGEKDVPVFAGVTKVAIPWENVPSLEHFCLLLRWESPTDPMLFEGPQTSVNTQYNNNIAWKNAKTVPGGNGPRLPFALGNAVGVPAHFDLAIRPVGEAVPGGRIVADLGPTLFERWQAAGSQGDGIKVVGQNAIEVVDPYRAQIKGLLINPGERPVVYLTFSTQQILQKSYVLDVVQVGPVQKVGERYDVGGVTYTFVPYKS